MLVQLLFGEEDYSRGYFTLLERFAEQLGLCAVRLSHRAATVKDLKENEPFVHHKDCDAEAKVMAMNDA